MSIRHGVQYSSFVCEITGGRLTSPLGAYCYTDEQRGLEDANVCAACLLDHLEKYYGTETPSGRHIRRYYRDQEIPGCDRAAREYKLIPGPTDHIETPTSVVASTSTNNLKRQSKGNELNKGAIASLLGIASEEKGEK